MAQDRRVLVMFSSISRFISSIVSLAPLSSFAFSSAEIASAGPARTRWIASQQVAGSNARHHAESVIRRAMGPALRKADAGCRKDTVLGDVRPTPRDRMLDVLGMALTRDVAGPAATQQCGPEFSLYVFRLSGAKLPSCNTIVNFVAIYAVDSVVLLSGKSK